MGDSLQIVSLPLQPKACMLQVQPSPTPQLASMPRDLSQRCSDRSQWRKQRRWWPSQAWITKQTWQQHITEVMGRRFRCHRIMEVVVMDRRDCHRMEVVVMGCRHSHRIREVVVMDRQCHHMCRRYHMEVVGEAALMEADMEAAAGKSGRPRPPQRSVSDSYRPARIVGSALQKPRQLFSYPSRLRVFQRALIDAALE